MIQFLRGTQSQLQSSQQIFAAGQPIFESDTGQLKIGNGINNFAGLPYVGSSSSSWTKISADTEPSIGWVSSIYTDLDENTRLTFGQGVCNWSTFSKNTIVRLADSNERYQWCITLSGSQAPMGDDPSLLPNKLYFGASANQELSFGAVWVSGCFSWTINDALQVQLSAVIYEDRSDFDVLTKIPINYWIVSSNN